MQSAELQFAVTLTPSTDETEGCLSLEWAGHRHTQVWQAIQDSLVYAQSAHMLSRVNNHDPVASYEYRYIVSELYRKSIV